MTEAPTSERPSAVSTSRWGRATSDAGDDARGALSELAASYYYCVYAWWRRAGHEAETAAAATLASFGRWLGESPPRRTDSGSERMRTWLLERLVELSGEALAAPAAAPIAFDPQWVEVRYADEPPGEADAIFQRRWALTVLEFTVATMSAEYAARGEEKLFPELVPFAGFDSGAEDRYAAAAARIGRTVGAMHKEVFDFRHRQRELLIFFAGDSLLDPAEAQSEITAMLCACDAPGPEAATARLPTAIGSVHPDEMLARAMQSVRMTGGGSDGWHPPTVAEAARLFPQYEVCALLGRGGMGAVYQGRQVELDRLVAIKLLPLEVSVDRDFADRFRREARAMARLQHPNIIDVHDFGTTAEGHLYFVMEYVDGANLDAMIRGPGLEPAQALEIIGSVCDALAYAHAEGVVHRDIKPANVMVSTRGRVKVADFGLARLTDSGPEQLGHTVTGTVMGTPDYMAPEQKRGMAVDHRADIYSLGVMLYEMLCREVPQGIFDPPSQRVAVDSRVDQVVIKAMQQQPDRRFQSTQEMRTAVTEASAPQPLAIAPKRGALARLPLGGMSRAMTMLTPGAAPRSKKKPLFAGLGFLAIGAAALFYLQPWKKSAPPSPSPAPQVAAPPAGTGNPAAVTKTAAFGPWQPFFTDAEWNAWNRKIVDGRMHLTAHNLPKPQPAADGAIRARLQYQEGTKGVGFIARRMPGGPHYVVQLKDDRSVRLLHFPGGNTPPDADLGTFTLPTPLKPLDTVLLELRLQADRLTVLVDGAVAIDVRDSRTPGPGQWGIVAADGWFESVEVQTPLPAGSAIVATKDAPFVNSLGMKFVPVPGTDVLFCIHETRWRDYAAYVRGDATADGPAKESALKNEAGGPDNPAARIVWGDAEAFCAWLSRTEGRTYRLPTDREWSDAVGLGDREKWTADTTPATVNQVPDQFPWGTAWPPPKGAGNYRDETFRAMSPNVAGEYIGGYDDGFRALAPVMSFTPNPLGLYDLGGNVAEWVADWADPTKAKRVLRGSSYSEGGRDALLSSTRSRMAPNAATAGVGFRVVLVPPAPAASATPAAATKEAPFVNTLGMKFVPVPIVGGPTMGKPSGLEPVERTVLFSVWDARVQDYEVFAKETQREWPKSRYEQGPTHPAVMVNWDDATAFCAWLTERERKAGKLGASDRYRLPTDHEWSCAVGIGGKEDATKLPSEKVGKLPGVYPWGSAWPPPKGAGNYAGLEVQPALGKSVYITGVIAGYEDGFVTTAPVGSFAANRFGLYDMGGNVWQWCEDWYDASQRKRLARGGSWDNNTPDKLLASHRVNYDSRTYAHGFRCVLEAAAPVAAALRAAPPLASQSDAATDGWQDLLAPLTPELLAQTGDGWRLQDGALYSPAKKFGLLPLTERYAGTSYQLRVKLRQLRPTEGIAIVLPVADRMVGFALDGWPLTGFYTSLNLVNGQFGEGLPGSIKGQQIRDSEPHELEVAVRLEGANLNFQAVLDGRPLYAWLGPIAALSQSESWRKTPPGTLAFGTMTDIWVVSEVKAKRLNSGASAPPAEATKEKPQPTPSA